ncbi:MAG: hypothetical protein ABL949_14725 [Fimbriimonadaceae bacterium]
MKNLKVIIAATLVAIAAVGSTQGMRMMGMGGGGSPTQLLYAGGGGFGRGGGGGGAPEVTLRADVSKELKITDDQKTKIIAARSGMGEKMRDVFQNSGGDREAMQKGMADLMTAAEKEVNALLTDGQKKRLKELWIQRQGNNAIQNEEIQKELGFTDEQKEKVKDLNTKSMEAMQALFEKMRNQEIEREQMQESMAKNQEVMKTELGKILTTEQASKLKAMGGAAFTFDKDN